jgi:hypothetical protein
MAPAKNSLQAILNRQVAPPPPMPAPPPIAAPAPAPAARTTPARAGKRLVAGHFDPKVATARRLIAAEEDTTIQALLEEAIDLLLVKKGRAPMAR